MQADRTPKRYSFAQQYSLNRYYARAGYTKGCSPRPALVRTIGCLLHPEDVTSRWHAGGCDPDHRRPARLSRRVTTQWRVACALRGVKIP